MKETVVHGEEGAAEHGNQRQVVARVREEAQEGDPVLGLPRLQEVAPSGVHRGDAGRGEGIPVDLQRRPDAGEYGHVPRPHGSGRPPAASCTPTSWSSISRSRRAMWAASARCSWAFGTLSSDSMA